MLFLFCSFIPAPCLLWCHPMFRGMSPLLRLCRPIYVPDIRVCLSPTGLLLRYWPRFYVSWRLGIPFLISGCDHFCGWVRGIFCRIWYRPSGGYVLALLPLWGPYNTCTSKCQKSRCLWWVDWWPWSNVSDVYCIFAAWAWSGLSFGAWWGGPLVCSPLIASVISGIIDLLRLWLGCPKEPFIRIQINPIWQPWLCRGGFWTALLCQTGLSALMPQMMTPVLS